MVFLNPAVLFGLFALAIPIVIHLFNFRRYKKVYFTNVRFLKEMQEQTRKTSRLKHWLALFLRMLAIAALVFAFARPYIPSDEMGRSMSGKNIVSVFVDNSFSMEAESADGVLFDLAREKAREIVSSYGNADLYHLLSQDFEGKHQRMVSREEFNRFVDEVDFSPSSRRLPDIILRQYDLMAEYPALRKDIYVISDFQESLTIMDDFPQDSNLRIWFVPVETSSRNNLFIDSCWFSSPVQQINQAVSLNVRVVNASNDPYEKVPLKLMINGSQKALSSFSINASETRIIELAYTNYESGSQNAVLEITDYPIVYDDRFFFSYEVKNQISVLEIYQNEEDSYIEALFGNDSLYDFNRKVYSSVDFSAFHTQQVIVLNGLQKISSGMNAELKRYVEEGGSLVVFPAKDMDAESYTALSQSLETDFYGKYDTVDSRIDYLSKEHPVFTDVFEAFPANMDMPSAFAYYQILKKEGLQAEQLMAMRNGSAFLMDYRFGNGHTYLFCTPLNTDHTNLPRHALFVPVMVRISLLSNPDHRLYYPVGEESMIDLNGFMSAADDVLKIKKENENFEFVPALLSGRIWVKDQVKEDGNYVLYHADTALRSIAFNYARSESFLNCYTGSQLSDLIKDASLSGVEVLDTKNTTVEKAVMEASQGTKLWRLLVLMALVFLLGEILVLRLVR